MTSSLTFDASRNHTYMRMEQKLLRTFGTLQGSGIDHDYTFKWEMVILYFIKTVMVPVAFTIYNVVWLYIKAGIGSRESIPKWIISDTFSIVKKCIFLFSSNVLGVWKYSLVPVGTNGIIWLSSCVVGRKLCSYRHFVLLFLKSFFFVHDRNE